MSNEIDQPTPSSTDSFAAAGAKPRRNASRDQTPRDLLSSSTSLDDLFSAILGDDARESDDRGPLVETVEAQVREIREELGLVESAPVPRPLPEFIPVFRTQPPEELTFSGARGEQWTVARPRGWGGLVDLSVLQRVPRAGLVAVAASVVLFIAGLYWGTTSQASLPPPQAPAVQTATQNAPAPIEVTDVLAVATSAATSEFTEPATSAPTPAPVTPAPAPHSAPDTTRSSVTPIAPRTSTSSRPSPSLPTRAGATESRLAATAVDLPAATSTVPRPIETVTTSTPIGTTGTSTPQPVAATASPIPEAVIARQALSPVAEPPAATVPPPVQLPTPTPTPAEAPAVVTPPTPAPAPTALDPSRVTRGAMLVSRVPPVYPDLARRMGTTGDVDLDLDIDATGRVVRASPVSGPRALRDAAETAVLQWRYQPQLTDGTAVPSRRRVRVSFK